MIGLIEKERQEELKKMFDSDPNGWKALFAGLDSEEEIDFALAHLQQKAEEATALIAVVPTLADRNPNTLAALISGTFFSKKENER